jgi:transposase
MTTTPGELPTDLETCHQLIRELLESLSRQSHLNEKLQHQLEQLLRRIYGRKSEKLDPNQLLLFAREILEATGVDPAAALPAADAQPVESDGQPDSTKKNGHGRKPLPKGLERKRKVHDVPPEQLPCPDCGAVRTSIGEEIREQLEFKPASLIVIEHVRPKYACKSCQANVVIAERLPEPIEKGLPGPGLLAQVIVSNTPTTCRCIGRKESSAVTAWSCRVRRCATGWQFLPNCWNRSSRRCTARSSSRA